MTRRRITTAVLIVAALLWAVTVGAMYRAVRKFESTPGRAAEARVVWPPKSTIDRGKDWTVVMLVHPHCSCSRASVQELERIIEKSPASLHSIVLVYRPHEFEKGWEKTDVVEAASRLPRARLIVDEDGREAKLFGGLHVRPDISLRRPGHTAFLRWCHVAARSCRLQPAEAPTSLRLYDRESERRLIRCSVARSRTLHEES